MSNVEVGSSYFLCFIGYLEYNFVKITLYGFLFWFVKGVGEGGVKGAVLPCSHNYDVSGLSLIEL